jgi:hypothetical protein
VPPEVDVLVRVALSLTGQLPDAEDLVQDTLLRAWRSFDSFEPLLVAADVRLRRHGAAIKTALGGQRRLLDPEAVARLRDYGARLVDGLPGSGR